MQHAVVVRSIDAADEDFTDLEPLMDAIGSAQVVQLGEPSHGAGGSFAAKVRLIKFLHQRMGFDLLAWESGMHGLRVAQAGLRAEDDEVTAAQRGIFTIWSNTEELKPLFEYVKAAQSSTRPLEMAGFDLQFTARQAVERFSADLRTFVSRVRDHAVRSRSQELAEQALAAYQRICCARREARSRKQAELAAAGMTGKALEEALAAWDNNDGPRLQPTPEHLDALNNATDGLLRSIAAHRSLFEQVHGPREASFMEHAIENMRSDGASQADVVQGAGGSVAATFRNMSMSFNRRDAQNARNLRWLIEKGYPGRKMIVWAHNVHIINAYFEAGFRDIHLEPQPGGMKPTGVYVAEWFGDKVYTIGVTTYAGLDGWATSTVSTQLPSVAPDSLEARLHALGKPYLFVDFRALDATPDHPLRSPHAMRILVPAPGSSTRPPGQGNYTITDISRAFDALFYIDQMTPATRIGETRRE
ncbi:MAG: erythromycin esterase family protein [Steroidobacter sp.]